MRTVHNTAHFSKIIAKQYEINKKACHKAIIKCAKKIVKLIREGNDIVIEDHITIFSSKKSTIKYIKNGQNRTTETGKPEEHL